MNPCRPNLLTWSLCGGVFALDQLTKLIIVRSLEYGSIHPVLGEFFSLVYVHNTGAAWGLFAGRAYLLGVLSLLVFAGLLGFYRVIVEGWFERHWAAGLLLGGIAGNVVDRFLRPGVVDFLSFRFGSFEWPAFNVADSAICVGVGLYFLSSLLRPQGEAPAPGAEGSAPAEANTGDNP